MSILKSLILGAAAAYGIQHITKKRADGSSILSDFMDNPPDFVNKAKDYATETAVNITDTVKNKIPL